MLMKNRPIENLSNFVLSIAILMHLNGFDHSYTYMSYMGVILTFILAAMLDEGIRVP